MRSIIFTVRTVVLFLFGCYYYCCFCHGQQAPFYDTQKFDPNAFHHRTDLCDRHRQLWAGNISLPDALRGLDLSVVLTNYAQDDNNDKAFFALNDAGVIDEENPGLIVVVLDELADRAGFTWRNTYGVVSPIDSKVDGNKTWSDLLAWEVVTYDISAGKWDRSIERMEKKISFPEGWYDSSMILVHSNSGNDSSGLNVWSFLTPFQWGVWLLLGVVIVVSGLVYWFLERLNASADERELEHRPGASVFYSAITFTGHFEFRPHTPAAMILAFSLTFVALITGAVYTANLASFLVARRQPSFAINSVDEAVLVGAPICIQEKVNIDDYITKNYPKAVLKRQKSKKDVFLGLRQSECSVAVVPVSAYDQYSRDSEINGDCSLVWNGRVEQIVPAGFSTDVDTGTFCTSLVSHVIDLHLLEMKAEGFLDRAWEAHLHGTGDQKCIEGTSFSSLSNRMDGNGGGAAEDETYSLSVEEMAGIFIIHAILTTAAVVVALIGFFAKNRRKRNGMLQDNERSPSLALSQESP